MIYDHFFERFLVDISYFRIHLIFICSAGLFQPIYAEAVDPNYIALVHESSTHQTYEELKMTQTNFDASECSHNKDSVVIGLPNQGYANLAGMNPYVNAP